MLRQLCIAATVLGLLTYSTSSMHAQLPSEKSAVAAIKSVKGRVVTDKKKPGNPVIRVFISNGKPTDEVVKTFQAFKHLQYVYLENGSKVTDEGIKFLVGLDDIYHINVRGAKITDKGLMFLSKLKNLKSLTLSNTLITDAGMKYIGMLPKLESLRIIGTKVTDDGLWELRTCKELKSINAFQSKTTKAGATKLRKALPKLRTVTQ